MKKIFSVHDFSTNAETRKFDQKKWTAIVPMAGVGSRLGFDKPKALYSILGKTILEWMLSALEKNCEKTVLVVSPSGHSAILDLLKTLKKENKVKIVIQETPNGMADAVLMAKETVKTPNALVIWGDQVTVSHRTLSLCQSLLEETHCTLALPTHQMKNPYICLDRDMNEKVIRVRQKREGEIQDEMGENDCGVFCFDAKTLFQILEKHKSTGANTREFNLLPLLPIFDANQNEIVTLRLDSAEETLGVNTLEDAKNAEKILSKR